MRSIVCFIIVLGGLAAARPARAADGYPLGAIAYFDLSSCPSGWSAAIGANGTSLNGFTLVPFASPLPSGTLGTTVNHALNNGENRGHRHAFFGSINLTSVSFAGAAGDGNDYPAADGSQSFVGQTEAASTNLPYLQLLLCQKTDYHHDTNPPVGVPQYVNTFFTAANCPTGWKPALATSGRFIVGLPPDGTPGVAFGGNPLAVGEDRTHTHAFSGAVKLTPTNVALASGCCAGGYGGNEQYDFSGTTAAASTGLPYVVVNQCQTCLPGDQDPACAGKASPP